jgi:hypothetical protein
MNDISSNIMHNLEMISIRMSEKAVSDMLNGGKNHIFDTFTISKSRFNDCKQNHSMILIDCHKFLMNDCDMINNCGHAVLIIDTGLKHL